MKKTKVSQGDTKKISQRTIKTRQLITLKISKLPNPHPHKPTVIFFSFFFSVRLTNTNVRKTKVSLGDTKKISQRTIKTRQLITEKIS